MTRRILRCRHAFEYAVVHANGEVVCSIIDGRGDFVIGNVHEQSLSEILGGPRAAALRRLVLSTPDSYCAAVGKRCPLKSIPHGVFAEPPTRLRFLAIEATTACDLRCLSCPVRDMSGDVTWRDAFRDGGASFFMWDGLRRAKQHSADAVRGIQIHFDFAHTWGRSRRRADELRYLVPYLKPFTALPGEPRQDGW